MKQLLFLLLFPCLAMAQYPGNAGQKITLGEQTTADGLVFRGVASIDTVTATSKITRANKLDTSAFLLLDTVTNLLWHYKTASNGWIQAGGGDTSLIAYVNTYGTQTVNGAKTFTSAVTATRFNPTASTITGTGIYLPQSNNLGISTNGRRSLVIDSLGNIYQKGSVFYPNVDAFSFIHLFGSTFNIISAISRLGMASNLYFDGSSYKLKTGGTASILIMDGPTGGFRFFTIASGAENSTASFNLRFQILNNGNIGIGTAQDIATEKLHVNGNARITALNGIGDIGADANGVLQAATSDMNLKNTIENSPFGLNEILLLNPVTFLYNDINRKIDSDVKEVGFIAQDVFDVIPNAVSSTGTGDLQLDYRAITATLTKAIQEQQALIKALEQRILTLENK